MKNFFHCRFRQILEKNSIMIISLIYLFSMILTLFLYSLIDLQKCYILYLATRSSISHSLHIYSWIILFIYMNFRIYSFQIMIWFLYFISENIFSNSLISIIDYQFPFTLKQMSKRNKWIRSLSNISIFIIR
jgi:hypothetical protein